MNKNFGASVPVLAVGLMGFAVTPAQAGCFSGDLLAR
jgi:hypothetical protein